MLRRSTEILAGHIYKVPSEWMTGGPGRSNHIWNSYAGGIRGEKGGARIEASLPYPIRVPQPSPLRALPKIRIPQNPLTADQSVRRYLSYDLSLGSSLKFKSSLDRRKEWIKATERKVAAINKKIIGPI